MDDLAFVRSRIESYADYTNDDTRHFSDELVRSYAGEALSRMLERLQPAGSAGEALAGLLMRCQFADQRFVRALDAGDMTPAQHAALVAADRAVVELADTFDAVSNATASASLASLEATFDRRLHIAFNANR